MSQNIWQNPFRTEVLSKWKPQNGINELKYSNRDSLLLWNADPYITTTISICRAKIYKRIFRLFSQQVVWHETHPTEIWCLWIFENKCVWLKFFFLKTVMTVPFCMCLKKYGSVYKRFGGGILLSPSSTKKTYPRDFNDIFFLIPYWVCLSFYSKIVYH